MAHGCDVSTFQGDIDPEWFAQWDFVIVRAFDRHGDLDSRFLRNWKNAAGRTLRGAYGWPRPGADNRHLGSMLATVASDAELGLWADYEYSKEYGLAHPAELWDYLDGIGDVLKGVYANVPTYRGNLAGGFADALPWWVANYGPNDGQRHDLSLPPTREWQIHQYTSRGEPRPPQASGLDLNYAPTLDWSASNVPEKWYPKARRLDGQNAGYEAGLITDLWCAVAHYTVGRNSTGTCGRDFQFLVSRDGTVWQGAEVDSVNYGSGDPWNKHAVHVEIEYHPAYDDAIFTPEAREATRDLMRWLNQEWGIPLDYYDGPRVAFHRGVISHRSLLQTGDWHNDYWPQEDWAYIAAPDVPKEEEEDMKGYFVVCDDGSIPGYWFITGGYRVWAKSKEYVDGLQFLGLSHNGFENPGKVTASFLSQHPVLGDSPS